MAAYTVRKRPMVLGDKTLPVGGLAEMDAALGAVLVEQGMLSEGAPSATPAAPPPPPPPVKQQGFVKSPQKDDP